jgi:hypothetical protein
VTDKAKSRDREPVLRETRRQVIDRFGPNGLLTGRGKKSWRADRQLIANEASASDRPWPRETIVEIRVVFHCAADKAR